MTEWELFGNRAIVMQKEPIALTIGNFDGVHAGHVDLLNQLREAAQGMPAAVLTFDPHPLALLGITDDPLLLCSLEERVRRILRQGIDTVIVQKFTHAFASMNARSFCSEYLRNALNVRRFLVGYNFRFGAAGEGNYEIVKELEVSLRWQAFRGAEFRLRDKRVSSTEIRKALRAGQIEWASSMLGRRFEICGVVVTGDQRGRTLGFPTMNLSLDVPVVLPKVGVYAGWVSIEGETEEFGAVLSLGFRPTFGEGLELRAEAHVLDYSGNAYDRRVCFFFEKLIRDERRFGCMEELKSQIQLDVREARLVLNV